MNTILVAVLTVLLAIPLHANQVLKEQRYHAVQAAVSAAQPLPPGQPDKILIDAIEDLIEDDGSLSMGLKALSALKQIDLSRLELADQIRAVALDKRIRGFSLNEARVARNVLEQLAMLDKRTLYELLKNPRLLKGVPALESEGLAAHPDLELLLNQPAYNELSPAQIQDLFFKTPELEKYKGGAYANVPRLFMFCSHERDYPCLMLLKDKDGKPVYLEDGKTLWSQPALGLARSAKPFTVRSGYTPSGIYEVNGVMPAADQQTSFGKFRRMILEFIPKSENELQQTYLLPSSHWEHKWWRDGVFARDIGRDLLRIHGTGKKNAWTSENHRPFAPTAGCVAQREGAYSEATYIDQRHILDRLMEASGLEKKFENEANIKALFYVVEVTNKKGAVDLRLLNDLGIR
ncbi:MAG TPA: L,D-transpeptidase [Bdellovibrionales bacterium]|nr:L,D-transpeptidase [Bdellovibrionales bacterium]